MILNRLIIIAIVIFFLVGCGSTRSVEQPNPAISLTVEVDRGSAVVKDESSVIPENSTTWSYKARVDSEIPIIEATLYYKERGDDARFRISVLNDKNGLDSLSWNTPTSGWKHIEYYLTLENAEGELQSTGSPEFPEYVTETGQLDGWVVEAGITDVKPELGLEPGVQLDSACSGGSAHACKVAGIFYGPDEQAWKAIGFDGLRTPDFEKAAGFFLKACESGEHESCSRLGIQTYNGNGIRRNYRKAAEYFELACVGDNALGCAWLGNLYKAGRGVFINESKGDVLHEKACELGYSSSCEL